MIYKIDHPNQLKVSVTNDYINLNKGKRIKCER